MFHSKNGGFIKYSPHLKNLSRKNRQTLTEPELKFWFQVIKNIKTSFKFLRQKPIANFILDFYCSKLLLAIEIDGNSHYQNIEYDKERTKILNALGIKVLRYNNEQVMKNIDGVYDDFINQLNIRVHELKPPVSPLTGGNIFRRPPYPLDKSNPLNIPLDKSNPLNIPIDKSNPLNIPLDKGGKGDLRKSDD